MFSCVCLIWLGAQNISYAAPPASDYQIAVWTGGENGLRNSSVTGIAQTPDGYLWVGTYDGLARFDGQRFVMFDPANTAALQRARIRRLMTDSAGTLWINTHDGSLTSYRDGIFELQWQGDGSPDAVVSLVSTRSNLPTFLLYSGELIRPYSGNDTNRWQVLRPPGAGSGETAVEDSTGVIWCRGKDQKVWRLVGESFEPVTANGLLGTNITYLTADGRGCVWVGTEREMAQWNGSTFLPMTPTNGEPSLNVNFLRILRSGEVWSMANDRVRKARDREWVFELVAARGVFTGWRDRTGLLEDESGGVWIYDYGKGLFHIRSDGRVRQLVTEENFPGERVDCFFEDREGNFWAGVDRGGLVRIREKRFTVLTPGETSSAPAAVTVAEDAEGAIWVGTFGGGLHRWLNEAWRTYSVPGGTRRGFVFSLAPEPDGRLWASAGDEDLVLGADGKFNSYVPAVHGVKTLLRATDGRLWIGTKSGLGVITETQFRKFSPIDGVARSDVRVLAEDGNGNIWAGTGDGTLYRVNSNGVAAFRVHDEIGAHPIWSLAADTNNVLWVGTFRGGLLRFKDEKFARITTKDGLPDDVICQLLDDGAGRLWVGSKQGIFHVEKTELNRFAAAESRNVNCVAYGRYDGLPSLECSDSYQPAAWRTRDGRLLFATLRGVVAVRPAEVSANSLPPPVLVESVTMDGADVPVGRRVGAAQAGHLSQSYGLLIPPGKSQVEFHFTGLSFVSPDRVRFRYRLQGLDRDWIDAGTRRSAQYSFLRPGNYVFQVKACNNDGIWNEQVAELSVEVQPHFYETWWFHVSKVFGPALLLLFLVRHFYRRRMRRQLERLERQRAVEQDRARIAKDIHDDLGAGLTHIALLSELARRDSAAALPDHVSQISDMARELTRSMDEIVWAVDPHNDTLDSLVTYVSKFAQEYLSVAGIRCRLDVPAELPPYALPAEVRHNLFLAIKEALNNVVQHARASEAWVRLVVQSNSFTVVIEDDGCGLPAVAGSLTAQNEKRTGRIVSGHGLPNMQRRLSTIGGLCRFAASASGGARVEFSVNFTTRQSPELVTGKSP